MDKAIVFGAFEFLGFHCCYSLLDKGYEVTGIQIEESKALYIENMRLEIGRNANFFEVEPRNWNLTELNSSSIIFIDYYDLYLKFTESAVWQALIGPKLQEGMEMIKSSNSKIVLLLPIQKLINQKEEHLPLTNSLEELRNEGVFLQIFYLPTIYGPWQNSELLFQKSLLGMLSEETSSKLSEREWINDAIFVKDVVRDIIRILEEETSTVEWILESDVSNHWEECADYLNIDQIARETEEGLKSLAGQIPTIKVIPEQIFPQGLLQQKKVIDSLG